MRTGKTLVVATREYATEQRWRSWWNLWSTLIVLAALLWIVCGESSLVFRVPCSVLLGLILVRLFVLYHDQQHGAILRGSWIAELVMQAIGWLSLNPPSVWKRSHDHHHRNNSKTTGTNVGSYPLMTVEMYRKASGWQRFRYAASRHPLMIACGYVTVFVIGMCVRPFLLNPRRHIDAACAIAVHLGILGYLASTEPDDLVLAALVPFTLGSAIGAFLFFAQHNFPGVKLRMGRDWNYVSAALDSSSYVQMGPVMRWFTGNIGYHHVHHLNARIPFYRLPEAMSAIPELQQPTKVSLSLRDIAACFRLNLWDCSTSQLVQWSVAERPMPGKGTELQSCEFPERLAA